MIVKDEEQNIRRCIDSVKDIVNEIIVIDTGSVDSTKMIANEIGAKVYDYTWNDNFSDARNFSITKSTSDWNIVLDADEYIISNGNSIIEFINKSNDKVGRVNILSKYILNGQEMVDSSFVSRLFPNKNIYYHGRVHEQLETKLPRENVPVLIGHDGYFKTDKTFRNLPLLLTELKQYPNDSYLLYQVGKQYFLREEYGQANNYYLKSYKGINSISNFRVKIIVDFLYSLIKTKSFSVGLEIIKNENKLIKNSVYESPDYHFVCGLFYMELVFSDTKKYISYFSSIERAYLKCIELGGKATRENVIGTGSYLAYYNLGAYYESLGQQSKALEFYIKSSEYGYKLALERISLL